MHVKQFGLKVFEWCLPQLDYAFHILASILTEKDILYMMYNTSDYFGWIMKFGPKLSFSLLYRKAMFLKHLVSHGPKLSFSLLYGKATFLKHLVSHILHVLRWPYYRLTRTLLMCFFNKWSSYGLSIEWQKWLHE